MRGKGALLLGEGINAHALLPVAGGGSESSTEGALEVAGFVPLKLATSETIKGTIVIEVRRGAVQVKVSWPLAAMTECGAWLRELMK